MEKRRDELPEIRFQSLSNFRQSSQNQFVEEFITAAMGYKNINPQGRIYSVGLVTAHSENLGPQEDQKHMNGTR